jgi:microcystin-dependent protein
MDEYIGVVKLFAGNFSPQGWLPCDGRLISAGQNQALFSIIGTTYGGDGAINFALPDLRSRIPVGAGAGGGPGLPMYTIGQKTGAAAKVLEAANMPAVGATATIPLIKGVTSGPLSISGVISIPCGDSGDGPNPKNQYLGNSGNSQYSNTAIDTMLGFGATFTNSNVILPVTIPPAIVPIQITGANQPIDITPPILGMMYIICVEGLYPSRP